MVERKRKKKNRLLGNRSHGAGNTKNRRGAGCRGGRGRAGSHKHKFNTLHATFGIKRKLKKQETLRAVNLEELGKEIEKLSDDKKIEKKGDLFIVDGKILKIGKILGRGNISQKIMVKNLAVSKSAEDKIVDAGGEVEKETIEEETKEEDKE
ncbi:MAG: uL15m family ribosomal protein [Candidatus Diapherotrites archaeon]